MSYLTVKRWSLRPWMRFLLIILNPSGYDNAGPDIPKSRRLASCYHSSLWSKWIEDFLEPEASPSIFFQHTFTQEGDIWLIQSENAANIIWREFFLDGETLFTTFPSCFSRTLFVYSLAFMVAVGSGVWYMNQPDQVHQIKYLQWGLCPHPARPHLAKGGL